MMSRSPRSHPGILFFGAAAVILGVIGLTSGDFATNWQRVLPGVPFRESLAYLAAACELLSGLAIFWRRTAQAGAFFLVLIYTVFAMLWVVQIFNSPLVYDNWGNFFEELSLVIGALLALSLASAPGSALAGKSILFARLYGICAVSFGAEHFIYFTAASRWVPPWIPPGQRFWTAATGALFLMAAAAILCDVLAPLATRLLAIMIMGFEILVWLPRLIAAPHDHFNWAGNGINLAMISAAWVVADASVLSNKSQAK